MFNLSISDYQYRNLRLKACWHLAYYHPNKKPVGSLSNYIIEFKDGNLNVIKKWAEWAGDQLEEKEIQFDYIVRALGSQEISPGENRPLDILGEILANRLNAEYIPGLLGKKRATKPMHNLNLADRKAEITNVYYANGGGLDLNNKNVIILDDITTTTCTAGEIKRALKAKWPNVNLYLLCLGRTTRDEIADEQICHNYFDIT